MGSLNDPSDPAGNLIAGGKVAGTSVYNLAGEKLGAVEDVMIDKQSGRIAYAIMSFGGFLGLGARHHPLPWSALRYDPVLGGFSVDIDRGVLQGDAGEMPPPEEESPDSRVQDPDSLP